LLSDGILLSNWAVQEGSSDVLGHVHERLLSLYTCAGCGLEAEHELWEMKLLAREPDAQLSADCLQESSQLMLEGGRRPCHGSCEAMSKVASV
jgi:hypothetical protein